MRIEGKLSKLCFLHGAGAYRAGALRPNPSLGAVRNAKGFESLRPRLVSNGIEAAPYRFILPVLGQDVFDEFQNRRIEGFGRGLVKVNVQIARERILPRICRCRRGVVTRIACRRGQGHCPNPLGEIPMSAHLAVLARAGLVRSERQSRSIIYRADLARLRDITLFLVQDCCGGRPEVCAPLIADLLADRSEEASSS
jgi:hypothetical protein